MTVPVGLIAGAGALAEVLACRIRASGRPVVCVQVAGEPGALAELCRRYAAFPWEQALEALQLLKEEGVEELVMAGKVDKLAALRAPLPPALGKLQEARDRRDPRLWEAVHRFLRAQGFRVVSPARFLPDLVAPEGSLAGPPVAPAEWADLTLGFRVARQVAAAGIGQAVGVREGVVLAVEAAEGTDAMIRRCGSFGPGAVVVKVAWPGADPGFDPPVVGPGTLEAMREAGARVLGVQAGAALLLDPPTLRGRAEEWGLSVVGMAG